ncbi:MAG: bifunctional aspartate kinase/homoserine dehydrogenase I [Bacteroidaceae bacterium]
MKVIKFGGTSVGSIESILNVKRIVEKQSEPTIVVVSALGGITDKLLQTSTLAAEGNERYRDVFADMFLRHHQIIDAILPESENRLCLLQRIDALFSDLKSIYQGVFLIRDLTQKTADVIVSYGERLSSLIVAELIDGAVWFDSRKFIRTEKKEGKNLVDFNATNRLIQDTFAQLPNVSLVPGFISSDIENGNTTNLGRGGSDYTAAILAAELNASVLEIWTDVDGFMTADPRVIPTAYTIDELSYVEAMELCNFGAKVVYPPTIYPVCVKNIPILIKNTFRPEAKGSIIHHNAVATKRPVKGLSSINEMSMVTVSGLSMVGVIGVNRRIFATLAGHGISVFMVAQTSSETSTSICMTEQDAEKACLVLDEEFAEEIATGAMYTTQRIDSLATIAVVGEGMKHVPGIAGKLFGVLGRNGISVFTFAQSAPETNISFVVERNLLRKSLNVIHDSFFLNEYQVLNLFICGVGTVGSSLMEQIAQQRDTLMRERGLKLNVVGIASGHLAVFDRNGIHLASYREAMKAGGKSDMNRLKSEVIGMNIFNSVFVDCTASGEVAELYQCFLEHNISVVTANKVAASSAYANYERLKQTARYRGVKFLFETNVGAGLPIIKTINDLINSGDKILRIEAVLSGTLNFVFNTLSEQIPLSRAVTMAKEEGYSEPDPRIDLCGKDVVRKLVILAREAGYPLETEEVEKDLFIPQELFDGSLENFLEKLPLLDADFETRRKKLAAENKRWRFVACWDKGKGCVALREVAQGHPFYDLEGSNNIIQITTERYKEYPMLIQGYGAGAAVTAAGVFADIMSIANI